MIVYLLLLKINADQYDYHQELKLMILFNFFISEEPFSHSYFIFRTSRLQLLFVTVQLR